MGILNRLEFGFWLLGDMSVHSARLPRLGRAPFSSSFDPGGRQDVSGIDTRTINTWIVSI